MPAPPGADPTARSRADGPGVVAWYAEGFSDVLGDRLGLFDSSGPPLQLLRFSSGVLALPDFEIALRGRLAQVYGFAHPAFAQVRSLTTLDDPSQLALVSEQARGERLSAILRAADARGARLDVDSAIWLLRSVVSALADFHEATGGLAHGWLDADRVAIAPTGDVTITEYVFGAFSSAHPHASPIDDVKDAAWLGLAVLAGRTVAPADRADAAAGARAVDAVCGGISPASVLAPWLRRALAGGFSSARAAMTALDDLLAGVSGRWPSRLLTDTCVVAPGRPALPVAPTPPSSVATAVVPPPAAGATIERLSRRSRILAALVVAQSVVIVGLFVRGVAAPRATRPETALIAAGTVAAPRVGPASSAPGQTPGALVADAVAAVAAAPPRQAGAAPVSAVIGWLVVESTSSVRVYANGRLLGTTTRGRFGLPAGQHTITVVSDAHGFRSSQPVRIVAGRSALIAPRPEPEP